MGRQRKRVFEERAAYVYFCFISETQACMYTHMTYDNFEIYEIDSDFALKNKQILH